MITTFTDSYRHRRGNLAAGIAAIVLLLILMAIAFIGGGCGARTKIVTDLPTGVTMTEVQAWDSEVAALHKMATVTSSVRQGVIGLEKTGAFPDSAAYVKALQAIAKVDQLELAASDYLKQTPQHFGAPQKEKIRAMLTEIGQEISGLNLQSLVGLKSTQAKKDVDTLVTELVATMNLALSFAQ